MLQGTRMPQDAIAEFPCPICGSGAHQPLYPDTLGESSPTFGYDFTPGHTKTYRVVRCQDCRHCFASPRPSTLWQHYEHVEDLVYLTMHRERLATAEKVIRQLRRYGPGGRLLDVGCGTGDFLSIAQQIYQVEGVELSRWAAEVASRRGFVVHRCPLSNVEPHAPYDLITLWGVIEHFEHPSQEVAKMSEILRPGGLVALWTGDVESFPSRVLGRKWWYLQGQHLQMFSRRSLSQLFQDRGFEKVWSGLYPYVLSLQSIAKSLNRYQTIGAFATAILSHPLLAERMVTLRVPGEMFAIFRKRDTRGVRVTERRCP